MRTYPLPQGGTDNVIPCDSMRFTRNQITGALILLTLIWLIVLWRVIFSGT